MVSKNGSQEAQSHLNSISSLWTCFGNRNWSQVSLELVFYLAQLHLVQLLHLSCYHRQLKVHLPSLSLAMGENLGDYLIAKMCSYC